MSNVDLVVSIVHYNTPELLRTCLKSIAQEGSPLRVKVVVVDNASTPPLVPADLSDFPGAVLISNTVNSGFGSANNQAFRAVEADYYAVTNPDVRVSPGSFRVMIDRLKASPKTGALGARLNYPDGRLQASCRRFPTFRAVFLRGFLSEEKASRFPPIRRYLMLDDAPTGSQPVDWVLGSCLFMKAEAVKAVGGFDESYFMYYEDIDLCHRLWRAGWSVEYFPEVAWIHDYRRQSARRGQWRLRLTHFGSALRFLGRRRRVEGWRGVF